MCCAVSQSCTQYSRVDQMLSQAHITMSDSPPPQQQQQQQQQCQSRFHHEDLN